ncbi:cysteine--tRNA ligase, partial [Chloroflexota bacterium]
DYGKLSHRTLESMITEMRVEAGEDKENPMDFVLWKAAKPGEPTWASPWGEGRPGWHIECSAMSLQYLGDTIDIHGGGQDLIFPHHENEIAQSESFTGKKPFVRYWMHNGLLQFGEEKMSKSLDNLITIREALENYSADAIRIFILGSHYRSPLTYSEAALEAAEKGAERLRQTVHSTGKEKKAEAEIAVDSYRQRFTEAMDDDFNTAQAIAALFDLARDINRAGDSDYSTAQAQQTLSELGNILGLTFRAPEMPSLDAGAFADLQKAVSAKISEANLAGLGEAEVDPEDAAAVIQWLVDARTGMRRSKQFQLADEIRIKLDELGIALEDTPGSTVWKRRR